MKVLVVEDDAEKLQMVAEMLHAIDDGSIEIETAHNAAQAKKELLATQFDVMILDVLLPASAEMRATPTGGTDLLRAIERNVRYKKPREIIGLTAYTDLVAQVGSNFTSQLWTLIHFDRTSDAWAKQIARKIRYLLSAGKTASAIEYGCDLCVLTALYDPELKALLRLPWNWKELDRECDASQYWVGQYQKDGETRKVIAASATKMGMPAAASLSMKMILTFHPKYLCMVGIAAGIRGNCSLGDVLVADPCWDWGSGKFKEDHGITTFEAAPDQFALEAFAKSRLKALSQNHAELEQIRSNWPGEPIETVLQMHVGPLASGASVLSDAEHAAIIKKQHRKLVGIDMEAFGVFAAADEAPLPRPIPFVIKSVVDFADKHKEDSHQAYAAYTSVSVLRRFAETEL